MVKPYDSYGNEQSPVMARKPRVYRVPRRVEDKVYPILDQHLACWDLYAEFEDVKDPKTRYVMASHCRYTKLDINKCRCGICM